MKAWTIVLGCLVMLCYSAASTAQPRRPEAPDVCCASEEACGPGYVCEVGGDSCNPDLRGRCVPVPLASGQH